jgi:hypothetical protein
LVGQALIQRLHGLAAQDQRLQPSEISLQEQTWRGHGTSVEGALPKITQERTKLYTFLRRNTKRLPQKRG